MDVILIKEDRNNRLDIPPPTPNVSHQTGQENRNRNLNDSQNNSGTSAPSSQNEVNGASSELLSSANNKEKKRKDQRKGRKVIIVVRPYNYCHLQLIRKIVKEPDKCYHSTLTILDLLNVYLKTFHQPFS